MIWWVCYCSKKAARAICKKPKLILKRHRLNPDFSQANNNYGVYLAQLSRNQEAIAQFQIAGSALGYDGRASALENLGRTALKVKNKPLAIQSFIKALDANRQSIVARTELIDILLADGNFWRRRRCIMIWLKLLVNLNLWPAHFIAKGLGLLNLRTIPWKCKISAAALDRYPLSDEAKQIRSGLLTPTSTWK